MLYIAQEEHPSDVTGVNIDLVYREFCGVINVWSEGGQIDNETFLTLNETTIFD